MNFRSIFGGRSSASTYHLDDTQESTVSGSSQRMESRTMDLLEQQQDNGICEDDRWYNRDADRLNTEIAYMAEHHSTFTLQILNDPESTLDGSLCWHGIIKPQIMEDLEWEVVIVYQGLGGGKGDWCGSMSIYLTDPSFEQVAETLGYTPGGFRKDADGSYTLSDQCYGGVRSAMEIATLFCNTIEKMCIGEISEDFMDADSLRLPSLA